MILTIRLWRALARSLPPSVAGDMLWFRVDRLRGKRHAYMTLPLTEPERILVRSLLADPQPAYLRACVEHERANCRESDVDELTRQYPFWWPVRTRIPLLRGEGQTWLYGNVVNWEIDPQGVAWLKIQTDPHQHDAKLWVRSETTESTTLPGSAAPSAETHFPERRSHELV
jgi:hypothetical protein